MCGICGYISKTNELDDNKIKLLNNGLKHRGPDEEGYYTHKNISIGHRRLSIIDLKTGQQPMYNDTNNLIITYNGELYNYKELKQQLIKKGYSFKTNSDTEVVLKCYEYYGNSCVNHFRGMFALAIVSLEKKEVFIARDHLGIKPLVFYNDDNHFAFSSEISSLASIKEFNKDIDYYAIDQYLSFQYIPAPRTIYRKINKLLPAHYMVVDFNGKILANKNYWKLNFNQKNYSEKKWLSIIESEIKESVKKHTVADVKFGAFLSGGIDSTLIVKYMTQILGEGINTYTIGFKDSKVDESYWADQVAKKYNTNHKLLTLEGNALELLPKIVQHYGEPFGDFSAVPTYYVSQMASQDVKMVLSGDGADEGFAGYSHYPKWYNYINADKLFFPNSFIEKSYPTLNKLHPKRYPNLSKKADFIENYLPYRMRIRKTDREQLWNSQYRFLLDLPNEIIQNYQDSYRKITPFNRSQYFDCKVFLPSDILTKVDIASMMNSLEVRTPLVDKTIFELASQLPLDFKLNRKNGEWNGKAILKRLLEKDFDDNFIYRKKQGFEIPLDKWLFEGSNFKKSQEKIIDSSDLQTIFNKDQLVKTTSNKEAYSTWQLLVLSEWFEQYHIC